MSRLHRNGPKPLDVPPGAELQNVVGSSMDKVMVASNAFRVGSKWARDALADMRDAKRLDGAKLTPVKKSSRTCFGIEWYATRAEAIARSAFVVKRGDRVNGGYFHGQPCGRASWFDEVDHETGQCLFAVKVR